MIAKALSHEPQILFLDEPTAGVDVELRKDMWQVVRELRASGVTIILTTHYIEEAEEMADRIGVINKGEIILVEDKAELMRKLGKKQLTLHLHKKLDAVPAALAAHDLTLADGGNELVFTYDTQAERTGITALLTDLNKAGIRFRDLQTTQSSLEDIFVGSGERAAMNWRAVLGDLPLRDGAHRAHHLAEHRLAGALDLALFRGVRRGDRLAHHADRGRPYGAFIVPGLIMLMLLTQSTMNASFGIYFPRFIGTIYEILSAPVSALRDRARLCRGGRHQVDHPRADHPGHRPGCSCRCRSRIRSGCWPSWC